MTPSATWQPLWRSCVIPACLHSALKPPRLKYCRTPAKLRVQASWNKPPPRKSQKLKEEQLQRQQDQVIILGTGVGLTALVTAGATFAPGLLENAGASSSSSWAAGLGTGDWGAGDSAAALLWAFALWFCSPAQLLLLFFGKIETERPSDEVIDLLGRLTGQRVDDVDYDAPVPLRAAAMMLFALGGFGTAWLFQQALGDATWAVSTGLGACMAAGVYEVGRPQRLTPQEAVTLEAQWKDFAKFADERLQRTGRCHESEVFKPFRARFGRYRSPDALPDAVLRDMVRNWHPDADRTPGGFYRNLSPRPYVDPFTGERSGLAVAQRPRPQQPKQPGVASLDVEGDA